MTQDFQILQKMICNEKGIQVRRLSLKFGIFVVAEGLYEGTYTGGGVGLPNIIGTKSRSFLGFWDAELLPL